MIGGTLLLGFEAIALEAGWISGFVWMIWIGLGSYLAYGPYGSLVFERLLATSGVVGTAVFAINAADAVGCTGSVCLMILKDLLASDGSRLDFLKPFVWVMSVDGTLCLV